MSARAVRRRRRRRRKAYAIVTAALALLLAAGGGTALYLGVADASRAERFRERARADWGAIASEAGAVAEAIGSVSSPESLGEVAEKAAAMSGALDGLSARLDGRAPAGRGGISDSEKAAVAGLKSYVDMVHEIAVAGEEKAMAEKRGLLENRSRRARESVKSFLSEAEISSVTFPGAFYQAGAGMAGAFRPPDYAGDSERKAIHDTMTEFMRADVKDGDFEKIWSMLSSRMTYGLEYNKISKERLAANWGSMWGDKTPVDYYVSWRDINIPEPETATSVVIAYMSDGGPRAGTVRLVKEQGQWKIDTYPFTGFLG